METTTQINYVEAFPNALLIETFNQPAITIDNHTQPEKDYFLVLQYRKELVDDKILTYLLLSFYKSIDDYNKDEGLYDGVGPQVYKMEHLNEAVDCFFDRKIIFPQAFCTTPNALPITDKVYLEPNYTTLDHTPSVDDIRVHVNSYLPSYYKAVGTK